MKTTITNDQLRDIIDESPASPEDNAGKLVIADTNGKLPATVALSNKTQIDGLDGSGLININKAAGSVVIASETIVTSAGGATHTASDSVWTKKKEILYKDVAGTITVSITAYQATNNTSSTRARIYKNGSAVGVERTITWSDTGGATWSENFSVVANDLIQVYLFDGAGRTAVLTAFTLRYAKVFSPETNTVNL
jgi:hypothetical protein